MTIHKSKGLEFPVVIVAGTGKKFVSSKTGRGFFAHKDMGIGITKVDPQEHWHRKTLLQMLIDRKIQKEEMDETIRVLYVALTRAKDRLIITGTGKYLDDGQLVIPKKPSSFMDQLIPLAEKGRMRKVIVDRQRIDIDDKRKAAISDKVRNIILDVPVPEKNKDYEQMSHRLGFEYEDQVAIRKKSKYSVTEYSRKGSVYETQKEELKVPAFMRTTGETSAARRGTAMHKVMEVLNFQAAAEAAASGSEETFMNELVSRMIAEEQLLEEERSFVECDKIMAFFRTEVGKRAAQASAAGKLRKEAEFNFMKDSDGVEVMVQGVIDCFFEEDDGYVLVDYKNSYIDPENREASLTRIRDTYTKQVELYREALEIIKDKPVKESYLYLFSEGEFLTL